MLRTVSAFRLALSTVIGLFALMALALTVASGQPPLRTPPVLHGGEVHGFVAAGGAPSEDARTLPLVRVPNIRVSLRNLADNTMTAAVVTNTHGYFAVPRQRPGRYQLCMQGGGFIPTCDPSLILIAGETIVLDHDPVIAPEPGVLRGRVLFGKPARWCYRESQQFGTLVAATVSLVDPRGTVVAGPVSGNSFGQYVLPKVPSAGRYNIVARCAGSSGTRVVSLAASDLRGAQVFDVTSANSAPVILGLRATLSGRDVRRASPGDILKVTVEAEDRDHDAVHFAWADSHGNLASVDAATIDWKLPAAPSTSIIAVQVTDGKGGFASDRLVIQTGSAQVLISGTVTNRATATPIDQADVHVNGTAVKTNAVGAFRVAVPENKRYVVNVKKPAFALLSRVVYGSTSGLNLKLDEAPHVAFDARTGTSATYDGKAAARITIRAGTLVDTKGAAASGPASLHLFAYDLAQSNAIPGDGAAIFRGRSATMVTFGAIDVTVTDANGQPLRLAPGATADIDLAIHPPTLKAAPATIPLFAFDEKTGIWMEDGTLTRTGNRYVGKVKHFSAFNADTVFSNTACIKMSVLDQVLGDQGAPPFPFILHVSFTSSNGGPNHNDFQVTEKINGLFRLPPNTPVTLEIHPGSGPDTILQSLVVNSGPPDGSSDGFPDFPYGVCKGFDPASTATGQPVVLSVSLPPHDVPYLGIPPAGSDPITTAYYTTLGAIGGTARDSFDHWKATNGFDPSPSVLVAGEANAVYYNNGDLQFGRDMHCLQQDASTGKAACYVSNYGTGPAGPADLAIHDAIHKSNVIATVTMEYDGTNNLDAVQFYAYKADGSLFKNPALDSEGSKFLPQLCLACHGGNYNSTTNKVEGASFLPFDVFSFVYDQVEGFSLNNQQGQLRRLNAIIAATKPNNTNPNDPITALINGLYPCGVTTAGCDASNAPPYTPPGWSTNTALYQNVPQRYCRTCHVAQPSYLDWTKLVQMAVNFKSSIQTNVCDASAGNLSRNHYMPHGEVPFKAFWSSTNPNGPKFLADPSTGIGLQGGNCLK